MIRKWTAEQTAHPEAEGDRWALIHDPTPGGIDNGDGTRTFKLRFPALLLPAYIDEPEDTAKMFAKMMNEAEQLQVFTNATDGDGVKARTSELLADIVSELGNARAKFPGDNVTFAALVEEVGELAKATFEEPRENVRKEAVQVAVMAMRMVLDGDHTYEPWRASKGLDPLIEGKSP